MTAELSPLPSDLTTTMADCPYRGLKPYGEEDADYYFGRDRERDLVIANVMATRLTVLYGPSGVGKSSLLRAGVVRLLSRLPASSFSYLAVGNTVVAYQSTWREDPLSDLGDALRAAVRKEPNPAGHKPPPGPMSLEMVAEVSRSFDADVFLVLDQFEEESLYCAPEAAEAFAVELGRIVAAQGVRVSVLIGIREDSLATLDHLAAQVPGLFDNTLRLDHLDAAAARDAIEHPLARYNADRPSDHHITIEPDLVDELLVQLRTGRLSVTEAGRGGGEGGTTIETPFLQLVMTRLWAEELASGSSVLRLSTLRRLGDAEHIVRTHLDQVMEQLTTEDRLIAASVFRFLVTPSGMKIAHLPVDLAEYAGLSDAATLIPVLEELSSGRERILRPVEPPLDRQEGPRYEIFHDVLAPAILDWRRRFVTEQGRLESERRLVEEREDARRQHEQTRRRLRRSRLFSGALALLLVAALASGFWVKVTKDAERATGLLSESESQLDRDPALALDKAVTAQELKGSPRSEAAVRRALDADHQRLLITATSGYHHVLAFGPDGRTFAAGGSSPTVILHDVATGRLLRQFPLASGDVANWVGISADGSMLAITTDQGRTTVHDTGTGEELLAVADPTAAPVAFARWVEVDGRPTLLTNGKGDSIEGWDPRTGQRVQAYGDQSLTDYDSTFETSADGTKVLTSQLHWDDHWVSTLRVWDAATAELLAQTGPLAGEVREGSFLGKDAAAVALWFKPNGAYSTTSFWRWQSEDMPAKTKYASHRNSMMSTSGDGSSLALVTGKGVQLYKADDLADDEPGVDATLEGSIPDQPDQLTTARLSPDGGTLVTVGVGGKALVWRGAGWQTAPVYRLLGHKGEIADAQFSPTDPDLLLTAGYDGTVRLWELPARSVVATEPTWMTAADVDAQGTRIVSLSETGHLTVVDASSGDQSVSKWLTEDDRGDFARVEWLVDGERVAIAANWDQAPWVWKTGSKDEPHQLEYHTTFTNGLAVSPDSGLIAMGANQNTVVVWDADSGKIVHRLPAGDPSFRVMDVEFVPGSSMLAAASVDGTVRVWNLSAPKEPPQVIGDPGEAPMVGVASSDDGRWLAATTVDRRTRVYAVSNGIADTEPALRIQGPPSGLGDVMFTPDGTQLVAGAGDGSVYVWERESGRLLATQRRQADSINSVRVLQDGRLVTASDDGTTVVSECSTCEPLTVVLTAAKARIAAREKGTVAPMDGDATPAAEAAGAAAPRR